MFEKRENIIKLFFALSWFSLAIGTLRVIEITQIDSTKNVSPQFYRIHVCLLHTTTAPKWQFGKVSQNYEQIFLNMKFTYWSAKQPFNMFKYLFWICQLGYRNSSEIGHEIQDLYELIFFCATLRLWTGDVDVCQYGV